MDTIIDCITWDPRLQRFSFKKTYHGCQENEIKLKMFGAFPEFRIDHVETLQDGLEPDEKEAALFVVGEPGSESNMPETIGLNQYTVAYGLLNGTLEVVLHLAQDFPTSLHMAHQFDDAILFKEAS